MNHTPEPLAGLCLGVVKRAENGRRLAADCPWCKPIPSNGPPVAVLVGCTCPTGDPCTSGRCPADALDDVPIGAARIVSNA